MTKQTAKFLLDLLGRQSITIGAPEFDLAIEHVLNARRELQAIVDQADAELTEK